MNPTRTDHEEWRPIPGWQGFYEVSDQGSVRGVSRTVNRRNNSPMRIAPRVLKSWCNVADGHPMAVLSDMRNGKRSYRYVHALVMEAFVGPLPEGQQVRHLNDVFTDNRLCNLAYGSRSENNFDRVDNGIHHFSKRDRCNQGHLFAGPNLKLRESGRKVARLCAACQWSYKWGYEHPEDKPILRDLANKKYEEIMRGWRDVENTEVAS